MPSAGATSRAGWPWPSPRPGKALRTAVAVRVGSDVVDLVLLGTSLPDSTARAKAAGVAGAWGTLCALGYLAAGD